jgi:hypothetical protein
MSSKQYRLIIAFAIILYGAVELLASVGLVALDKLFDVTFSPRIDRLSDKQRRLIAGFIERGKGAQVDHDPVLGWVDLREANSAGMRDMLDYARHPPPGRIRVAAFGDSFTYGAGVDLADSWGRQLTAIDPTLEVLNYGVGGYGLDQAYLRYLGVGASFRPHVVLIGYMSENISRHVNVFRPLYSDLYSGNIFTKPRFLVRDKTLVLLPNPLPTVASYRDFLTNDRSMLRRLCRVDHHCNTGYDSTVFDFMPSVRVLRLFGHQIMRRMRGDEIFVHGVYNPASEAYRVTASILENFHCAVLKDDALPIIVIFADLIDQRRSRRGEPRRYAVLLEHLRGRGYRVIDLLEALQRQEASHEIADLVVAWGHYSPLGSRIVAEYLVERLHNEDLTTATGVAKALEAEQASARAECADSPISRAVSD